MQANEQLFAFTSHAILHVTSHDTRFRLDQRSSITCQKRQTFVRTRIEEYLCTELQKYQDDENKDKIWLQGIKLETTFHKKLNTFI
jgi:hypothetical protein